jgi:hypothetical protein
MESAAMAEDKDVVDTAAVVEDKDVVDNRSAAPPSHACSKCSETRWWWQRNGQGAGRWRCKTCFARQQREYRLQSTGRRACRRCGQVGPKNKECVACVQRRNAMLGLQKIEPEYAEILRQRLDNETFTRLLSNLYKNHSVRFPLPSTLFPGLGPAMDVYLKREGRDQDVSLCSALAALPVEDQLEFLSRAVVDRVQADRWARLPRWQRPIMAADEHDKNIWRLFDILRLNLDGLEMAAQGTVFVQLSGVLNAILAAPKIEDRRRLHAVLYEYGRMLLRDKQIIGDPDRPPWNPRAEKARDLDKES